MSVTTWTDRAHCGRHAPGAPAFAHEAAPRAGSTDGVEPDVAALASDERDVVERLPLHGETMAVAATGALLEGALVEHVSDQSPEPAAVGLIQKVRLEIEGDPASVGDEVVRLRESTRRDVVEAERCHRGETVRTMRAQPFPLAGGQSREVAGDVVGVEARTIAFGRGRCGLEDVHPHERWDPDRSQLLTDQPVPRPDVHGRERRRVVAAAAELLSEQPDHFCG